jgi:hypothetical protein
MFSLSSTANVALDVHIVGWISDDHAGDLAIKEVTDGNTVSSVAAEHAMASKLPNVPAFCYRDI